MGCVGSKAGGGGNIRSHGFAYYYNRGRPLGSGAYSTVFECTHRESGARRAEKMVDRDMLSKEDDQALQREMEILKNMNHAHMVHVHDFFAEPRQYHIVIDLCEGGELFEKLAFKKNYSEADARHYVKTLLELLAYCHKLNVVHRDLKPENLLLEGDHLMVTDFGFAQRLYKTHDKVRMRGGYPCYLAPEVLEGRPYTELVDVWGAGIIAYALLSGSPPYNDTEANKLIARMRKEGVSFQGPAWEAVSDEGKDFLAKLLVWEPANRVTAEHALEHPWFKVDEEALQERRLPTGVEEMRRFNAKRKSKAAADAVMTIRYLNTLTRDDTGDLAKLAKAVASKEMDAAAALRAAGSVGLDTAVLTKL